MVQPRAFIPLHGTLHHLERHAALARELGVRDVTVLEDGDTATVDIAGVRKGERVASGRVHVFAGRALPPSVLHERMVLAAEGVAFAVVPLAKDGALAGEITLVTRGVVDETLDAHFVAAARGEARAAVEELADRSDDAVVAEAARLAVRRSFVRSLGWKPHTVVTVRRP
jgi:ribonuclease J